MINVNAENYSVDPFDMSGFWFIYLFFFYFLFYLFIYLLKIVNIWQHNRKVKEIGRK